MRRLKLSRKASQRIEAGHLWVYRGETRDELAADALEQVLLCDERGRLLGSALVDAKSPVPIRLYSRKEQLFDAQFMLRRVSEALAWRRILAIGNSTGFRLIFSEADGLPGLIVDRFGDALAMQFTMRNYQELSPTLIQAIESELTGVSVNAVVVEQDRERRLLRGNKEDTIASYLLNGLELRADLLNGPKTGAFLDQRENYVIVRNWAERLCANGNALDLFSASGGFALHLAQIVKHVDAVDSSSQSISTITDNAKTNSIDNLKAIRSDVKQFLRGLGQARRRYECVVVDPPAFAKSSQQKAEANRAYYDLNLRALGATASAGLFVTCSCSQAISESELLEILRQAAAESRRTLTILEKCRQSHDHREVVNIPETSYLKCLVFRLDQ